LIQETELARDDLDQGAHDAADVEIGDDGRVGRARVIVDDDVAVRSGTATEREKSRGSSLLGTSS
jgi:hypothetical protein